MLPVLDAYRSPDGSTLLVWCDQCERFHRHRPPITPAPRIAHCPTKGPSPYVRTGYKLRDAGPAPPDMLRRAAQQRPSPEGRQW